MVVGLAADAAGDPDLAHQLEHRPVGYARALLRPQAHRDLAVAAPVRRPAEDLDGLAPELGSRGPRRVAERVIVGRPGRPRRLQRVGEGESPPREPGDYLGPLPARSRFSAPRAANFFK